jgi:7-cyano-7-deazaguanine synthase
VNLGPVLKGTSPLVDVSAPVGHYSDPTKMPTGVEPTFVPGRNILFLTIAANRAYVHGCHVVVMGVCEADYGGYPDCRKTFIESMEQALGLGMYGCSSELSIDTPLMKMSKAESVSWGMEVPGVAKALAFSHTCYDGEYPPNPFNHASMIRAKGFYQLGIGDPLILRAKDEGVLPKDYPDSGYVVGSVYGDIKSHARRVLEGTTKEAPPHATAEVPKRKTAGKKKEFEDADNDRPARA